LAIDDHADDGGGDRDNKIKTTISISHKRGRGEEGYEGGEDKWRSPPQSWGSAEDGKQQSAFKNSAVATIARRRGGRGSEGGDDKTTDNNDGQRQ